ncbi:MAG: aminopeptidase P family protein [Bacteroidaceae bacterium]
MDNIDQYQSAPSRLESLRLEMKKEGYDYYIIPHTDPHGSEYLPSHWEQIAWLTGFTGSAGTLIIGFEEAYLWTDSRYFLQAERQLEKTGITLIKIGSEESILIKDFIKQKDKAHKTVAICALLSQSEYAPSVILTEDLLDRIWIERPTLPLTPIYLFEESYSGESAKIKLERVRDKMILQGETSLLLYKLDEIAWLLNIRGEDIPQNPVVISFLLLKLESADIYIEEDKLNDETRNYIRELNIEIHPYKEIDPNRIIKSFSHTSPVEILKAIKNDTEINGFHNAMKADGVAMVRFLMWLESNLKFGKITELGVADKLRELRSKGRLNRGESFTTIAGYGPNGAIVHYSASIESNTTLLPEGFLLVDSGGQYLNGTTDLTRTISLGKMTEQMRRDYTAVLRGTINLARAQFPTGTRGTQLDILARMAIWQEGTNYLHGTGHGVGHFLNVHEGPQSIRMNENPVTMRPGMVISDEPGIYRTGSHGVRIENLLLVERRNKIEYGTFYGFETLTLCPIDTKPIIREKIQPEELRYFNDYHKMVYEKLSPLLDDEENQWLKEATKPIA